MSYGRFAINNISQEVKVISNQINSYGGKESPILSIPIEFSYHTDNRIIFEVLNIKANLKSIAKGFVCTETFNQVSFKVRKDSNNIQNLEFHLTTDMIHLLENVRTANVHFGILLTMQIANYRSIKFQEEVINFIVGFENQFTEFAFEIEQSYWVKKILPNFGYSMSSLFEMPLSIMVLNEEYSESINELQEAERFFRINEYDKVVSHCRTALEPFKKKLPELKMFIQSESEYEWLKRILNSTSEWVETLIKSTSHFTSKPHHTPSVGHFSKSDAEVIYSVTISIIKFIGNMEFDLKEK